MRILVTGATGYARRLVGVEVEPVEGDIGRGPVDEHVLP